MKMMAVIAASDLTVHLEAKHLRGEVSKNDLMVFNQKGLDYLLGGATQLRRRPLYRFFLSGSSLSARGTALRPPLGHCRGGAG